MKFNTWNDFMATQRRLGLLQRISEFVTAERNRAEWAQTNGTTQKGLVPAAIYPASADVFHFTTTPLRDVKVVILGQDPYHGPGQADGLAFSVPPDVKLPPSLKNIFRELCDDIGDGALRARQGDHRTSGDLTPWTRQGVLLLNTALTVRQGEPGSHLAQWQPFTDEVVRAVVDSADAAPHFILWGAKARATFERALQARLNPIGFGDASLDDQRGLLGTSKKWSDSVTITATYSPHPSPLSADRGFFGSRPFSRANLALRLNNGEGCAVDWRLL